MNGYYPLGAEFDRAAPYNEKEIPEIPITVDCQETLSKTTKVMTCDYSLNSDGEFDGLTKSPDEIYLQEHFTISQMLEEYASMLKERRSEIIGDCNISGRKKREILLLINQKIEDATGWVSDSNEICLC
jgi:hypothetical protein